MNTAKARIRLVRSGFLKREGGVVVDASSTISLVEASDKKIIVDTGAPSDSSKLLFDLKGMDVKHKDVDIVINTHLHIDHCGCNELFENAVVYAHELESPPIGNARIAGSMTLIPGVELVHTPGHTPGSITVFVSAEKRYAICGDAIPTKGNYDSHIPPAVAFDRELALKSMDAIIGWADVVIPGHDTPFDVMRKK